MRKKMCFIIVSLLLVMNLIPEINIHAATPTNTYINKDEAVELAKWFIANDIYENNNNGWSEETVIEDVREMKDNQDYYIISLRRKDGKNNGYIVVSGDLSDTLIKEYAYDGKPLFVDLLPIKKTSKKSVPSGLSNEYTDIDLTEENIPFIEKVKSEKDKINTMDYGGITNPYKHVNDTYGAGWSYDTGFTIPNFTLLDMDNFNASNHCSLTTITAIFNYHRNNGYRNIPSNINTLFNRVKTIATQKKDIILQLKELILGILITSLLMYGNIMDTVEREITISSFGMLTP
ncbi:hypothetical protein [Mahella sp.]|uniref:hypothetical protein n=1 Tax=Mahella sp. TaxID=2798721 RepID=UPI0025C5B255|nr:hypothetical protein [Mahella sp.]MBZ4665009.1 hypothetical protein [Mahella sp.]